MFELLLITITALTIWFGWLELKRNNFDYFQLIFIFLITYWFIYVFKFFQLRAFIFENFPYDLIIEGLVKVLVGLIAFYLGYRSLWAHRVAARLPKAPEQWPSGGLFPYALFLFIIAVLGEYIFIQRSGGIEYFYSVARGMGDYKNNTAYLYSLKWLSVPASAIILIEIYMNKMGGWRKYLGWTLIAGAVAYQFSMGQRSGVLMFGLIFVAVTYYSNPQKPFNLLKLLLLFIPFYLAIGYLGLCRDDLHLHSRFTNTQELFEKGIASSISKMNENFLWTGVKPKSTFRSYAHKGPVIYLSVLDVAPRVVGYNYGIHYSNYLIHWIPRLVWPDKPFWGAAYFRKLEIAMGTSLRGPMLTVLAYFQANLGMVGIILGMLLTGMGLSIFYNWFKKHKSKKGALTIYLLLIPYPVFTVFGYGIFYGWSHLFPFFFLPAIGGFWYLNLFKEVLFLPKPKITMDKFSKIQHRS